MKYLRTFDEINERSSTKVRTSSKRKSPTDSATDHKVGTEMEGNDGEMWCVKTDKNGVKSWKRI